MINDNVDIDRRFNVEKMIEYAKEVISHAKKSTAATETLVRTSLERHKHLFHLPFDEDGRIQVNCPITEETLKKDTPWFRQMMIDLLGYDEKLAILNNQIWVTQGSKAMPLITAINKKHKKMDIFRRNNKFRAWYMKYEYSSEVLAKIENLLPRLGDVVNLDRIAVISINPTDYLRNALGDPYTSFTTCHSLRTGSYAYGSINYALDKNSLVSYIATSKSDKMLGRSMIYLSDNLDIVGQLRFYPTSEVFGTTRNKAIRTLICDSIAKDVEWVDKQFMLNAWDGGNGYRDGIAQCTHTHGAINNLPVDSDNHPYFIPSLTNEVMCLKCGTIHTNRLCYCLSCIEKGDLT